MRILRDLFFNPFYLDEAEGGDAGGGAGDGAQGGDNGEGGTGDAAAVEAALQDGNNGNSENGWSFAEGVTGEGDKPEWFKDSKYKTVADQAKAYTELEGRFGAFTGAPENYEVALSEQLAESGVTIDADDPMIEQAMQFAKDSNMSQEGFTGLVNLYGEIQLAQAQAMEQYRAEEMKALGPTANKRIANINAWAQANMSADLIPGFEQMIQSASGVAAVERLISMTRSAPMNAGDPNHTSGASVEELQKMQFEKDENGNRRINTDPAFKARYEQMKNNVYGSAEHRIIIGG